LWFPAASTACRRELLTSAAQGLSVVERLGFPPTPRPWQVPELEGERRRASGVSFQSTRRWQGGPTTRDTCTAAGSPAHDPTATRYDLYAAHPPLPRAAGWPSTPGDIAQQARILLLGPRHGAASAAHPAFPSGSAAQQARGFLLLEPRRGAALAAGSISPDGSSQRPSPSSSCPAARRGAADRLSPGETASNPARPPGVFPLPMARTRCSTPEHTAATRFLQQRAVTTRPQQQRGLTHFLPPPRGAWGAARRSASYPDAAPHLRRGCSARRTLCLPCCPLARSSADRG
jgi:hypothetical protein